MEIWDQNQLVPCVGVGRWVDIVVNNLDDRGHPFHLVRDPSRISQLLSSFTAPYLYISSSKYLELNLTPPSLNSTATPSAYSQPTQPQPMAGTPTTPSTHPPHPAPVVPIISLTPSKKTPSTSSAKDTLY
jgi:hypothetical protein